MFRFRTLLEAHLEELTRSVSRELGKNLEEARGDVIKAMEVVEMACGAPDPDAGGRPDERLDRP